MDIKTPINLVTSEERAKQRQAAKLKDWLAGFVAGALLAIIFSLLFVMKASAAPVNSPQDAERARAEAYLAGEGATIPEEVAEACEFYGDRYNIAPELLEGLAWVESRCIPSAQSKDKACKGLCQIKPACHQDRMIRLNALNVFDTWNNIEIAADYLAELGNNCDISEALMIYNGDTTAVERYHRTNELSRYAEKILKVSAALERSHNK